MQTCVQVKEPLSDIRYSHFSNICADKKSTIINCNERKTKVSVAKEKTKIANSKKMSGSLEWVRK